MSELEHEHLGKRRQATLAKQTSDASMPSLLTNQTVQRAQRDVSSLTPADVTALQRSVGNAAVTAMLGKGGQGRSSRAPVIQAKLKVGPADDPYEREADRVAQSVQKFSSSSTRQGTVTKSTQIQRSIGPEGGAVPGDIEQRLRRSQSGGSSLPMSVRGAIEPKLGADLSSVKAHTGKDAVQLTQALGAKAFTHQNHIYYGAGQSPNDLKLTAHESVHTIQQGAVKQGGEEAPDISRFAMEGDELEEEEMAM